MTLFKECSTFSFAGNFVQDKNVLCHFDRGHHGEQLCEIISNFHQWFRGRCQLRFSIISFADLFVQENNIFIVL